MVFKSKKNNCPTITLGMITKNEEKLLPQCLESVKNWVDEVIIVDNNSTDSTRNIAKKYGARVVVSKRRGNLSLLRNIYLKKAKCDWVFTLDADERVAQKDVPKIINLMKNKRIMGYSFISRLYTHNYDLLFDWFPCSGEYPEEENFSGCPGYIDIDWGFRLFRNIKGLSYEGHIHETIDQSIRRHGGGILGADILIHHFKELNAKKSIQRKTEYRFATELRKNAKIFNGNYRYYFRVGRDYLLIKKDYKNAFQYLKKSIELKPDFVYSYFLLALIYKKRRLYREAISVLKKAIKIKNTYVGAHYLLGVIYDTLHKPELSKSEFTRGLKISPNHPMVLNSLGVVLAKQKRINAAIKCFKKAVEINPTFQTAQNNLKNIEELKSKN